ncbi:MAG: hypothetical protein J6J60_08575 [Clostridia bacterium]|nr:hypothetical protein [Clostridia bacterium]
MEVNELIKYIRDMGIIDKLKLGISVFSSNYINTSYNKKEIFERMDNQLKKLDSSYIMTFSGIYNNKLIMFLTARIIEYSKEEQNRIAMYLVNCV